MRHGIVLFTCDRGITPAQAAPDIRVLIAAKPSSGDLAAWAAAGATEFLWGLPDAPREVVEGYLDRLADRVKA